MFTHLDNYIIKHHASINTQMSADEVYNALEFEEARSFKFCHDFEEFCSEWLDVDVSERTEDDYKDDYYSYLANGWIAFYD